ncbi:hypothetical protein M422DRAFT_60300 [Sphaerobolus stellatus SS14]|uniref:Uncharacterized protein n=1 Tax=Sphaerobolus stellatus (strain SS14) TaxID=990650 RepID=A0A0C9V9S8_SPHS4|nr:hypothetical protein M422DRAFT_60300 [Sphaerobolus stellatus SS14]
MNVQHSEQTSILSLFDLLVPEKSNRTLHIDPTPKRHWWCPVTIFGHEAPKEWQLLTLKHPAAPGTPIVDTHTELTSTFRRYRKSYPDTEFKYLHSFVRGLYGKAKVGAIVDVWEWDEVPESMAWKELADSAVKEEERVAKWGRVGYWFILVLSRLYADTYIDHVEQETVEAMQHPRCVGWGMIGLHYASRFAPPHGKDTERILKTEVPRDHPLYMPCYTVTREMALRLLEHFLNFYFGISVLSLHAPRQAPHLADEPFPMHILLETDRHFNSVPSKVYTHLNDLRRCVKGQTSHTGMIPWTVDRVARQQRVMKVARENARKVYGM